jgi:RHS repeat-associated protein
MLRMGSSGSLNATNTFGPNGLISRRVGSATSFYAFDPLGNAANVISASGTVLYNCAYDAYGQPYGNATTLTYGYGAQYGYYRDSEASTADNLLLCTYRWYDPATARWLTRDPIGYAGGSNLYGHVGGNPVGGVDPWGLVQVLCRRDKHKLMAYDHDGKLVFGPYDWGDKGNAPAGCYNLGRVDWLRVGNRATRSGSRILINRNHPRGTGRTRAQAMGDVAIFVLDVPEFPGLRIHYAPNPAKTEGCLASDNQARVNELAHLLEDEDQGWNQLTIVDKEPWDPILRGRK